MKNTVKSLIENIEIEFDKHTGKGLITEKELLSFSKSIADLQSLEHIQQPESELINAYKELVELQDVVISKTIPLGTRKRIDELRLQISQQQPTHTEDIQPTKK